MYEIGLVVWYDGPAVQIVGPYSDLMSAMTECGRRNKVENRRQPPGHGSPGWMTARWEEIPRGKDCMVATV